MQNNHPAVEAGIISAEAAFCGLSETDVLNLRSKAPATLLVVRFRSRIGDWRDIMPASQFPKGNDPRNTLAAVRDVFPKALD